MRVAFVRGCLLLASCLTVSSGALAASADGGGASAVEQAIIKTQSDIERDAEALNALRAEISDQRRPLAARLEALQSTVKERRANVERIRRLRSQGEKEQVALEAEAAAVEEECRFLTALFAEYARAIETRVSAAEAPRLVERLRPLQATVTQAESSEGFAEAIGQLLALSAEANAERLGGLLFEGVALDAAGVERSGRFAVFGPVAYFAAEPEGPAGLAMTQFGAVQPGIYDRFPEGIASAIRGLVKGESARVPVDATEGDAIKVADAKPTLLQHFKKGGFVMYPLLGLALAALVLALWKSLELGRVRVRPGKHIEAVLDAVKRGDIESARRATVEIRQPLRALVEVAVKHHDSPRDHLEEIVHEHVLALVPWLERNLGALAVLGGIAPLLGLLGTVTGMIHTFQLVTIFGSGDAKLLSGGISEALITTEAGLIIAIPVLLVHAFLARRARAILGTLESMAVAIVNDLKVRRVDS